MANWSGGLLTTKGQVLQAKVDAGQTELVITKMKIGSGTADNLQNLTDLVEPQQNIGISGITAADNMTTITGVITNAGLTEGFYVRELGVYATDPDDGEILYSVTADSAPDYLPAEGDSVTVSQEFNYYIAVSNASSVTATLSTSGLVTTGMLQTHTHDGNGSNGPQLTSAGLADNSVTDSKIGTRTIDDTVTAAVGAGLLSNLFSKIGNMIKSITGKSNWYTVPATTLEASNTHIKATLGAHTASAISSTATGNLSSIDVQSAIDELESEKAPNSHASTTTTYGVATDANYGHTMASSTTPIVAGTAVVGSETAKFARGDHVHPLQTTLGDYTAAELIEAASSNIIANFTVLTGTVSNGGTIPLPDGYTQDQCHWVASLYSGVADDDANIVCAVSTSRVVTCYGSSQRGTGTANYMIIGVK